MSLQSFHATEGLLEGEVIIVINPTEQYQRHDQECQCEEYLLLSSVINGMKNAINSVIDD